MYVRRIGLQKMYQFSSLLLFCLFSLHSLSAQSTAAADPQWIQPAAGRYAEDIQLDIPSSGDAAYEYRFQSSVEDSWTRYRLPLRLTAAPGEERNFQLEVRKLQPAKTAEPEIETRQFSFTIDKKAPPPPSFTEREKAGRRYVNIETEESSRIYYWMDTFDGFEFRKYSGGALPLGNAKLLKAYSVDQVGNASRVVTRSIAQQQNCEYPEEIELPSPVSGNFANPQWLVISNPDCFEWIRYTVDGSDAQYRGATYTSPVLLRMRGDVVLQIAAKSRFSDEIFRREVHYSLLQNLPFEIDISHKSQGFDLSFFPFPQNDAENLEYYYSLEDETVSRRHPPLEQRVEAELTEGLVNYFVYRLGVYHIQEERMYQYRYFYALDRRIPPPPRLEIEEPLPFSDEIRIAIQAPEEAEIYYSTDGTTPDQFSKRYKGAFSLSPEGTSEVGALQVKAIAFFPNGSHSAVTERLFPYDRQAPAAPNYRVEELGRGETLFHLSHPENDVQFVYEIVYSTTAALRVSADSPVCGNTLRITFPFGYKGNARLRFAALDKAGNLSQATAIEEVEVDTVPPPVPDITVQDGSVKISGEGDLFYKIDPIQQEFQAYTSPVDLEISDDQDNRYRIYAHAEDEAGNSSETAEYIYREDSRAAEAPLILGIENGESYPGAVTIRNVAQSPELITYYSIEKELLESEGSGETAKSEEDPDGNTDELEGLDFENRLAIGTLTLEGEASKAIHYRLRFRNYLPSSESWSEAVSYEFTIDRQKPQAPDLHNLLPAQIFNEAFYFKEASHGGGEKIWLMLQERSSTAGDIPTASTVVEQGVPLDSGIRIAGREGEELSYILYGVSRDRAGNTSDLAKISLTIDRLKPQPPSLTGIPASGLVRSSVTLGKSKDTLQKVVYELSYDGTLPAIPDSDSPVLESFLTLKGEEAEGNILSLLYRSIDEAGNLSDIRSLQLRFVTREPAPPLIDFEKLSPRLYQFSFHSADNESVWYSIEGKPFKEYEHPFLYRPDTQSSDLTMEAYTLTDSGVRSDLVSKKIDLGIVSQKLLVGVEDGGLYNSNITIRPKSEDEDLRFEIRSEQSYQPVLGQNSPRMDNPLEIRVPRGQKQSFRLLVGVADSDTAMVEEIQTYDFVIDKAVPLPPQLRGVENGAHYTEDKNIELRTESEDAILYYRVKEDGGPETPYRRYTRSEKLQVRPGLRREFEVESWAEDRAGNRSEIHKTSFVIDKAGIYVSKDGKDSFSGGKDSPFRSLDRALYEASATKRNSIYLSQGEYTVSSPATIDSQLSIRGGYVNGDWEKRNPDSTLISISGEYPVTRPIFTIKNGTLSLEQVLISNLELQAPLIVQQGDYSNLLLRSSHLVHANGNEPVLLNIEGGNLLVTESRFEIGPVQNAEIITLKNSEASFRSSFMQAQDGTGTSNLIIAEASDLDLVSTELRIASATSSITVDARDSRVNVRDSFIQNGNARVKSIALRQRGGVLRIENTTVGRKDSSAAAGLSNISTGIEASGARIEIVNSLLNSSARNGLLQLNLKNSNIDIQRSSISNSETLDFNYVLRIDGGSCSISDSDLAAKASYDILGIDAKNRAALILRDSTLRIGSAVERSEGIQLSSDVIATVQGSTLEAEDASGGAAALRRLLPEMEQRGGGDATNLKLIENKFSGWPFLLIDGDDKSSGVEELESEKPPYDTPTPHRGNRIVQ